MEKVFVNSLPKAGTNLLAKLIELIGYKYDNLGIASTLLLGKYYFLRKIIRGTIFHKNPIIVGLDLPIGINPKWLNKKLERVEIGEYITGHTNYSDHLYYLLSKNDFKIILVIRDPRDVLVSYAYYVAKTKTHFIYDFYSKLKHEDRLMFTITGGKANDLYIESFGTMLRKLNGWFTKNNVLIVKFENLIGPKGGGNREQQLTTIRIITDFLAVRTVDYERIANNLFGGTHTFRKGKIGSWRKELMKTHIDKLKEELGDLLNAWGYEW